MCFSLRFLEFCLHPFPFCLWQSALCPGVSRPQVQGANRRCRFLPPLGAARFGWEWLLFELGNQFFWGMPSFFSIFFLHSFEFFCFLSSFFFFFFHFLLTSASVCLAASDQGWNFSDTATSSKLFAEVARGEFQRWAFSNSEEEP